MRPYNDKLMDYNSPFFERGFAAGESCQPRLADDHTMSNVERARYREGWLTGRASRTHGPIGPELAHSMIDLPTYAELKADAM